jgi:aminocarboxymuconate-semialdehyde decarboxylase
MTDSSNETPKTWDLHGHCIPPGLLGDIRSGTAIDGVRSEDRGGQETIVHRQGPTQPLIDGLHDMDARLATMDQMGVDVSVLSLSPTMLMYWVDAADAVAHAQRVNDEIAQMCRRDPDRLVGTAHVAMQDPDAAVAEVRRATQELGLRGVQIAPMVGDLTLDEEVHLPVLEAVAEAGVPLTLHPYFVGVGPRPGLNKYYLTNLVGHPYQTAVGASRLIMSGALDRFPDLEVVLVHGGGYLPYQAGRLDHGNAVRSEARACQDKPSSYLRRFTYDTLTHSADSLRFLLDLVGPDRVAYGTDYPYDMGGGAFEEQLRDVPLSSADEALVRGGNAQRLYGR